MQSQQSLRICSKDGFSGGGYAFWKMSNTNAATMAFDGPTWEKQIRQDGAFVRRDTCFRDMVSSATGARFAVEPGRYHLYVSLACPWAHRTLITRRLLGLEEYVSVDVVDWLLPPEGWTLNAESESTTKDTVNGKPRLRDVYEMADGSYRGAVTVPVLWDRRERTIVNNESAEIIRMFEGPFREAASCTDVELYPEELREEIDSINAWVYEKLNNGVYRAGFARSQLAYEHAVLGVFDALERLEQILSTRRYVAGNRLTEADVRLWTTLIRFDAVYVGHFKCNLRRLVDFENLWDYTRELFSYEAFASTTNFEHIRRHYFVSHESLNPHRIVPLGPQIDYEAPHRRARFSSEWSPPG